MLKLRLLTGPRAGRQLRVSDTKPVSVGRRIGRLRLHDSRVSKNHAKLFFASGSWVLRDLGSANGTFVNQRKCQGLVELEAGDVVQMGRVLIKILQADAIAMGAKRGAPGSTGQVGIDAFTASGATGVLPALDADQPTSAGEADVDLTQLFGQPNADADDDQLDLSEMSRGGTSPAGIDAGETQISTETIRLEDVPIDDVSIGDELDAHLNEDEADPLLSGVAEESDQADTPGDLIALDDQESPPLEPGTTMLAALEDDEPHLVGLQLDLPAPQQPAISPATSAEDEAGPSDDPPLTQEVEQAQAVEANAELDRAEDASLTDVDAPQTGEHDGLNLEAAHAELAFEDVVERDLKPDDPQAIADELWPTDEAAGSDEAQTSHAVDTPAVDGQAVDEGSQQGDFDIDAAFDALSNGLDDLAQMPTPSDAAPDDAAGASDSQDDPADDEARVAGESVELAGSQLDVGFIQDALSRLDGDDADGQAELDTERRADVFAQPLDTTHDQPVAPPGSAAAIANEIDQDEALHAGPATAAITGDENEGDAAHADAINLPTQAPPGINPTSLRPPTEPDQSYQPYRRRKRMWFFMFLVLLLGLGLGIGLTYNYVTNWSITGRSDPAPRQDRHAQGTGQDGPGQDAAPQPITPITPQTPQTPRETQATTPDPAQPTLPTAASNANLLAGSAPVPDPFADGPSVLGSSALAGITVRDTDDAPQPTPTPPGPDIVIQPTQPDPGSTPTVPPAADPPDLDSPDPTSEPETTATPSTPTANDPQPQPDPIAVAAGPARIIFLVDASGSLIDSLPQMLLWLGQAVETIKPDEKFAIIFFKPGRAIENNPAGLHSPTRDLLAKLNRDWINPEAAPVLPSGRSNPKAAIERALSYNPTDLYLLSDESFARHTGDTTHQQAVALVADALGDAKVRLHGVQFFYEDEGGVLQTLANRFNGTFEFYEEQAVPEGEAIDLLEELSNQDD